MSERPSLLLNTNKVKTKEPKTKSLITQVANPSYPSYLSYQGEQDKVEQVRQEVREQVCYDVLVQRMDQELLDELIGLIVETLCDKAQVIRIGSHDYPAELVQERMRQIDSFCLEYVCTSLRKSNPSIRNIKQYLLMGAIDLWGEDLQAQESALLDQVLSEEMAAYEAFEQLSTMAEEVSDNATPASGKPEKRTQAQSSAQPATLSGVNLAKLRSQNAEFIA